MSKALLLDTCAVLWVGADEPIGREARDEISAALLADGPVFVSPISAWEIGMLASRSRIKLPIPPRNWFAKFVTSPGIQLADMSPDLLIASSFLPEDVLTDPADRIVAATAREFDLKLVTRDRKLLDYARAGHCSALAC